MVSLPLVFAPFRALIGFRSDNHRSALGWRRVPYIWMGTLLQFGGLAIMPFALIVLSGDTQRAGCGSARSAPRLAFLLVGAGLHTTQTAGLALATDLAPEACAAARRRAAVRDAAGRHGGERASYSAIAAGQFQRDASDPGHPGRGLADHGVERRGAVEAGGARSGAHVDDEPAAASFPRVLAGVSAAGLSRRVADRRVGLGTAAFSMQDILLEPYGGEILHSAVGETTALTAMLAAGTLRDLRSRRACSAAAIDPYRLAAARRACRASQPFLR